MSPRNCRAPLPAPRSPGHSDNAEPSDSFPAGTPKSATATSVMLASSISRSAAGSASSAAAAASLCSSSSSGRESAA
eukprot:7110547-Alexandrium_andersonii.AAC.1